jgi:hypothetical protein
MTLRIIPLLIFVFLLSDIEAQDKKGLFKKKRKKVDVENYTVYLELHDVAIEYSTKIDYKVDSLFNANNVTYHQGLFDFRIRSLQTLEHVLYRSDAVIAFLDSWVFGIQMVNYLNTPEAREYLDFGHSTMLTLFEEYLDEFPEIYSDLLEADPELLEALMVDYSTTNPITSHHLIRTSIIDGTAQWVGESKLGLTGGLYTMTDLLRNMSDRLNYHAEFTPKMIEYNVESTVGEILGTDSIGPMLDSSLSSLIQIAGTLDSIDHMVYTVADTLLADVDRQRRETLYFISSERKAVMEQISGERMAVLAQLTEERKAIEKLIREERQLSFDQLEAIITNTTDRSFDRVDDLANRIFFKVLILMAIIAIGLVLAVVAYKKL